MSKERVFLVAVNILDPTAEMQKIKGLLKDEAAITGWWNHIPGCFLVQTALTADQLTDRFRTVTHEARLLVTEVNLTVSEGWLPETSWQWIRNRETEKVS